MNPFRRWFSQVGGWLARGGSMVILFVSLVGAYIACFFLFGLGNRIIHLGRSFHGPYRRLIVVSNHQSLIDSFMLGWVLFFPRILLRPNQAPAHLADARNFMTHPVLRYVYRTLRVIPVGRAKNGERRDMNAFNAAKHWLMGEGSLSVFLPGTRESDERLLPPRSQVGLYSVDTAAYVLPVYFTGMHQVHPYRKHPGDPPATAWRLLIHPVEIFLMGLSRIFPTSWRWIARRFVVHWRRFILQTEWLLDVRFGHRIIVVKGDLLTPEDVQAIAGSGDHRSQVLQVTNYLHSRIAALKSDVDDYFVGSTID